MTDSGDPKQYPTEACQLSTGFVRSSSAKILRHGEIQVDVGTEQQLHRILAVEVRVREIEAIEVRPQASCALCKSTIYREVRKHER